MSGIKLTISERGKGLAELKRELKKLGRSPYVKVGVVGKAAQQKHKGAPLSMVELAATHELGNPKRGIPERSFLRSTFTKNKAAYEKMLRSLVVQYITEKISVERLLGLIGAKVSADVKATIVGGKPLAPPLSPRTIEEKKKRAKAAAQQKGGKLRDAKGKFFSTKGLGLRPLVDTGQLLGSLSWEVVAKGGATP